MRIKTIALAAAAAVTAMSAPAFAAPTFAVNTAVGTNAVIPSGPTQDDNNFWGELAFLGFTHESIGASVNVVEGGIITFEFLGSESGYDDFFKFMGATIFSENTLYTNNFGLVNPPAVSFLAGAGILDVLFGSLEPTARTASAAGGQAGFAVFTPGANTPNFNSNVIYFGYDDDNRFNPDDNHDDFIIRATISAVPEASTWAMMIAGFAAVGMAVRRRSQTARVSFS